MPYFGITILVVAIAMVMAIVLVLGFSKTSAFVREFGCHPNLFLKNEAAVSELVRQRLLCLHEKLTEATKQRDFLVNLAHENGVGDPGLLVEAMRDYERKLFSLSATAALAERFGIPTKPILASLSDGKLFQQIAAGARIDPLPTEG